MTEIEFKKLNEAISYTLAKLAAGGDYETTRILVELITLRRNSKLLKKKV